MTEFQWNSGLSAAQKKKNVAALHQAFVARFPEKKVLEISSKSSEDLGVKLSAFNLTKFVPSLGKAVPVECVYQGSKVFAVGGPYTDLYTATSRAAKGDDRLRQSGELRRFSFEGKEFPLKAGSAFYDWLYVNALMEHPELSEPLLGYDGFTDIEFNPNKGVACQANAAALYVSLHRQGLLEQCRDFDSFLALLK
jgi:type I restriction enzyme M protein